MASISSHAVQSLIDYLSILGISRQDCFDAVDLNQTELNQKRLIAINKYDGLYDYAEKILGDTLLGFKYGQHINESRWGVLGQIIYSSATIEQALQNQRQYQSMVGNLGDPNFSIQNNVLILTWSPAQQYNHHIAQELLTSWVEFARRTTATHVCPNQVWFARNDVNSFDNDHIQEYQSYFGCPVSFTKTEDNAPQRVGLTIDLDTLKMPCLTANAELNKALKAYADTKISQYSMNNPVSVTRDYIASKLPNTMPLLSELSSALALSERTLQRRLLEFDSSFKQLVDEVKCDIATHYLSNTQLSFQHISNMLGFSEQSAFSRAVKRWTKLSPAAYRKAHQILMF